MLATSKAGKGRGVTGTCIHCWWGYKMVQPLGKTVWQLLTKLDMFLPSDPAITFLGIYPNELKTYVQEKPEHKHL
jgi:hypothetical protein